MVSLWREMKLHLVATSTVLDLIMTIRSMGDLNLSSLKRTKKKTMKTGLSMKMRSLRLDCRPKILRILPLFMIT